MQLAASYRPVNGQYSKNIIFLELSWEDAEKKELNPATCPCCGSSMEMEMENPTKETQNENGE
jgi:hypothetical protein